MAGDVADAHCANKRSFCDPFIIIGLQVFALSMIDGFASPQGTEKYMKQALSAGRPTTHFRDFAGLKLSSLGIGTYLGDISKQDDEAVENAVYNSVKSGAINVIDTAINYRAMKSEKSIGRAISRLVSDKVIIRDQVFISTKNGYITNDGDFPKIDVMEYLQRMFITPGTISADDISSGYNVLHPGYIAKCIDKSLANMRLSCIDLVYVHNAFESWHADVSREKFMDMLARVFEVYENYRKQGKLRYYGMATWTCFRSPEDSKEYLSLESAVKAAESVGGKDHGFKFIQLPYNLSYSEALFTKSQKVGSEGNLNILQAAAKLGIGIFTSVPLFQGRLLRAPIPDYCGITDQMAKIVQVIRSSPSVIAPLIGQKTPEHLAENLKIADLPPLTEEQFKEAVELLTHRSK